MSVNQITVKVAAIEQVAPFIREFTLIPIDGELFPFSPGAHTLVEMSDHERTYKNAYSLLSDPRDPSCYKLAVRLQEHSRGGSEFMHKHVEVGSELKISPPANLFAPQWEARKHILIAGGVGITPFMSYLPELQRRGVDFELHYLYRSDQTGAYKTQLAQQLGTDYYEYDSSKGHRCDIAKLFAGRKLGTHFYICGPEPLIDAVKSMAESLGVPAAAIHYEEFTAPEPGLPFEVKIKSSGKIVPVASQESMLEALEAAGIEIPNLCRGGVCGQCLCQVEKGEIEHRDSFLSDAEKIAGDLVMPCVSRAKGSHLVLDI